MKKIAILLVLAMALTAGLVGCAKKPYEVSVCVGPEPATLDPALNSAVDGGTVINHLFEGLMTLDKNGTPVPGQAESYTMSADGMTYTFKLRSNLKWSDGKAVVAGDFVYAWKRAVAPETAADYSYMFDSIARENGALAVSAPDDKTVVVKLIAATPYFLELCAFPTFLPVRKDTIETNGDKWATKVETYLSNGPYKMKEWVNNSYIVLEKNTSYWNVSKIGPSTIRFLLMDDDNAILAAFQNGQILLADSMPNDEIDAWRSKKEFNLKGQIGTYYVSFNTQNQYLKNAKLRQALVLAVDRDFIVKNIGKAGQVPAGAFVSTGLTDADPTKEFRAVGGNYFDPTAAGNAANLAKAKALLVEAGFPEGKGLPTFEYLYNTSTGHKLIGEALQNMWAKIGVNITLVNQEWGTFLESRKNGEYEIARNGWLGDYNDPITFLDMWITGGGNNDAQWSNAQYDALIAQVKSSSDRTTRMKLMHQAEDIIFAEWMLCPIYYYVDIYLQSQKLQGFYSSPLGFKYFMYTTVTQ